MMAVVELQTELESFLARERIKIQDECSQEAVNRVINGRSSSNSTDRIQQVVDSWANAFLQVSSCLFVHSAACS